MKNIHFFDLDHTLFASSNSKIYVRNILTNETRIVDNYTIPLGPNEELDLNDFRSSDFFVADAVPIWPMIDYVKKIVRKDVVTIVTAREDMDDRDKFINHLSQFLPMESIRVERAGNICNKKGIDVPEAKMDVILSYQKIGRFDRVYFYEDNLDNLVYFNKHQVKLGAETYAFLVNRDSSGDMRLIT